MCEAAEKLIDWGLEQGLEQGDVNRAGKTAMKMYQTGSELNYIADMLDTTVVQIKEWLNLA